MTATYADSSALVKRYVEEPGSDEIRAMDAIVASSLAVVEICSAVWRRHRMGDLGASEAAAIAAAARSDLTGGDPNVIVLPPTTAIVLRAGQLTGTAALRAYDALQLASALEAREVWPDCERFACFDHDLMSAAASHGFALL